MAKHLDTGRQGEALAENALMEMGYQILERNWRHKHLEVDLIAVEDNMLVFVEVKTRNDLRYGEPHEAIDWKKEQKLARAANIYLSQQSYKGEVRFDIVSVVLPQDVPVGLDVAPTVEVIRDAFWPK